MTYIRRDITDDSQPQSSRTSSDTFFFTFKQLNLSIYQNKSYASSTIHSTDFVAAELLALNVVGTKQYHLGRLVTGYGKPRYKLLLDSV